MCVWTKKYISHPSRVADIHTTLLIDELINSYMKWILEWMNLSNFKNYFMLYHTVHFHIVTHTRPDNAFQSRGEAGNRPPHQVRRYWESPRTFRVPSGGDQISITKSNTV